MTNLPAIAARHLPGTVTQLEGHIQNRELGGKIFFQRCLLLLHHQPPYQCLFDAPPVIPGGLPKEPYIASLFFDTYHGAKNIPYPKHICLSGSAIFTS